MKKFSIIITTYNRRELFERAFKSAVNQNFDDYEIVVVNNGDDKVEDIIEKNKNNREVRLINYNEKKSPAISANIGIKNAYGEWICFLDDDDEILPYYFEEINKNIEPKDNWLLIIGILKKGRRERTLLDKKSLLKNFKDRPFKKLLRIPYFFKWAQVIKKEIYEQLGYFDENFSNAEDVDFILRMSLHNYDFKLIERPLYIYYFNFSIEKWGKYTESFLKFYEKHREIIEKDKEIKSQFYYSLGWHFLKTKKEKEAVQFFKKAFLTKPTIKSFIRMLETMLQLDSRFQFEKLINKITNKFWFEE